LATRTGSVQAVELVRGPDDAYGNEAATGTLYSASVSIWNNTASTVIGGTDTLSTAVAAAIQSSRRDGKTVTLRSAALVGAAVVGGVTYTGTTTFTSTNVSIDPLNSAWGGTPTLPANTSDTQRFFRVVVGYSVA